MGKQIQCDGAFIEGVEDRWEYVHSIDACDIPRLIGMAKRNIVNPLNFVIPHNSLLSDCCGVLYWGDDGWVRCNECNKVFYIKEN